MNPQSFPSLALPMIGADVPFEYVIPGVQIVSAPIAIKLIEMGLITDDDFRPEPDSSLVTVFAGKGEKRLVEQALTRWWTKHTESLGLFKLGMHIQKIDPAYACEQDSDMPWICLVQRKELPQYELARGITDLEAELPGFGQTVLAVIDDVLPYLPWALTPREVHGLAQNYYWQGESTCEAYVEWMVGPHGEYATREEMDKELDLFTDAEFYCGIPTWFIYPERIHSRKKLVKSAKSTYAKRVIAACDAIHRFVSSPNFSLYRYEFGPGPLQLESVGACALLRWNYDDSFGRVVDDSFNMAYQCGEYNEFASAMQIPSGYDITEYMRRMEQMCELAALAESLLNLIGDTEQ
jgi:PRTRC genetic system protein F